MSTPARNNDELEELKAQLWGSFLLFIKTFFPLVTGRPFTISQPAGRESHFVTICRELTSVARMQTDSLLIAVPPGSGKSTLVSMWIAWTLSKHPNSQYLYVSYGWELASKHTAFIKRIIECSHYQKLFGVKVRQDSRAKDFFQTQQGGSIKAFGSSGAIVGQDAGLPNCNYFTGAVILDDMIKVDAAHSDSVRGSVIQNYRETILQRPRAPNVPIIYIGQRVHEDDLHAYMLSGNDERQWKSVVLKALDDAGNALYPEVNPLSQLLEKQEKNPYVFASQYQQNPIPAGGALFKADNFVLLDEEPEIELTFITADTAETNKSYNDATVFSFWGLYWIIEAGMRTGQVGLHWLDCTELRIEPKDLEGEFMSFYGDCMLHKIKPLVAAIEKKSTGVTLCSILQGMRGLQIREVKRTKASGSKTDRYLEMQPIVASKLVSFTRNARHVDMCVTHMMKITAAGVHRHDDVCFVSGTKIATIFGYKNIEDIRQGDFVITPLGVGRVSCCGPTKVIETISRFGLTGTKNHPVWDGKTFTPLNTLCDAVKLDSLSLKGLIAWRYKKLLSSMALNIDLWGRKGIILASRKKIKKERVLKDFMWRFGNFIAERQFRKGMSFITRTTIILITTIATWSVFRISSTWRTIFSKKSNMENLRSIKSIYQESVKKPPVGIEVTRAENGTEKMPRNLLKRYLSHAKQIALFAKKRNRRRLKNNDNRNNGNHP